MFKHGDKVRRKKEYVDNNYLFYFKGHKMEPPDVFTVRTVSGNDIWMIGYSGTWCTDRFELARPKKYL